MTEEINLNRAKNNKLAHSPKFFDITFVTLDNLDHKSNNNNDLQSYTRFNALKALIAQWSPVFEAMLYSNFEESTAEEISLNDVSSTSMEIFLKIVHRGEVPLSSYATEDVVDLFAFTNMYQIPEITECALKELERAICESSLNENTCCELLGHFDRYVGLDDIDRLRSVLVGKMIQNFEGVCNGESFPKLSFENLLFFMTFEKHIVSEDVLFRALMRWMEYSLEGRVIRLRDIIQAIRFPFLSPDLLATVEQEKACSSSRKVKNLVRAAMRYQLSPHLTVYPDTIQFKKRNPIPVPLQFTTLGATGRQPPTTIGSHYDGIQYMDKCVQLTEGVQTWCVPLTGTYRITAVGAEGGGPNPHNTSIRGGLGAKVEGEFQLKAGDQLKILVGQKGEIKEHDPCGAAGGGGGSFVVRSQSTKPLIIGAGGNGCSWKVWRTNGPGGQIPTSTNSKERIHQAETSERGYGGGGFHVNRCKAIESGASFLQGVRCGVRDAGSGGCGGFGGGGDSRFEGGGGGGYIGGRCVPQNQFDSHFPAYGAISYNSGSNQRNTADSNHGDGSVTMEFLKYW